VNRDDPCSGDARVAMSAPAAAGRAANDDDAIVALDATGEPYPVDKWRAHAENLPHLAVSVFVFSAGRLLLQRRALAKYHSGGLWANTCCTHPRWRESPAHCARRRLREELGIDVAVRAFGRIDYAAPVGTSSPGPGRSAVPLFENESVHCFVAHVDERVLHLDPDPLEVHEWRWADLPALARDARRRPQRYTAWLRIYLARHLMMLEHVARPADIMTM